MLSTEYITGELASGNYDCLSILTSDRKMTVSAVVQQTSAELVRVFNSFASACQNGRYVVEAFKFVDATKSGRKSDFEQRKSWLWQSSNASAIPSHVDGLSRHTDTIMDLKIQIMQMQMDTKLAVIEQSNSKQVYNMLEKIFVHMAGAKPVAASQGLTGPAAVPSQQVEQVAELLELWSTKDERVVDTIAALVKMAADEPEKYATYRNILLAS